MLEPDVVNVLRLTMTWPEIAAELNQRGNVSNTGREWTSANIRRAALQKNEKRGRERKRAAIADLKRRPCMDCGGTFEPCQMDFDHRDGEAKLYEVSAARCTLAKALIEIEKCDLVCANCHRLRTYRRRAEACQVNAIDA